jgi:hypothetical protein
LKTVQIGIVGAMQRAHPALTQLWLKWTGVPDLHQAAFDTVRALEGPRPATQVALAPTLHYEQTQEKFCDLLGAAPDAPERRFSNIHLVHKSPMHRAFWSSLKTRELANVSGPLEWWWRLLVLRLRSVRLASRVLLRNVFDDDPFFDFAVLRFENPTLKGEGRRVEEIIGSAYEQPIKMVVSINAAQAARYEGLAFDLTADKLKSRLVPALVDLAISRSTS